MFEIVGDEIRFDGHAVAVFVADAMPTLRARAEDALNEYDADAMPTLRARAEDEYDAGEFEEDHIKYDAGEFEEDHIKCDADLDAAREELKAAEAKQNGREHD